MNQKLQCIKKAGAAVASILRKLEKEIRPGISGKDLEKEASRLMAKFQVKSSSLGYQIRDQVFPSAICVSLNEELTHGIPDDRVFQTGYLVSVDVAVSCEGYHADAAATFIVGETDNEKKKNLLKVTKDSLHYAIQSIKPGITTNQDIGRTLEKYIRARGYYPIEEYGGHGIGEKLHQPPFIPNGRKFSGSVEVLTEGMFICIEPLVQMGDAEIKVSENK